MIRSLFGALLAPHRSAAASLGGTLAALLLLPAAGCAAPAERNGPVATPAPATAPPADVRAPAGTTPAVAGIPAQGQDTRPGVAVLPFENGGSYGPDREDLALLTVGIQQMVLTDLARNSRLRVIERSVLRQLLEEQDLGASGRVDPNTAAQIGKLVGARYIITGVYTDAFGDMRIDARIIDTETSEILNADQVRGDRKKLFDMLFQLSEKMTAGAKLPPLEARLRQERAARQGPPEAVILYSRAQTYEDFGDTERAAEVYRQIVREFPQMVEAREALRQVSGG
jgi:TolB-like protein